MRSHDAANDIQMSRRCKDIIYKHVAEELVCLRRQVNW